MRNEMRIGCENCQKCFSGCAEAFPDKYTDGGAEKCSGFTEEPNPEVVYENMQKYVTAMKEQLANEGIYL